LQSNYVGAFLRRYPVKELSRDFIIVNELGLHARPAAKIARVAQRAKSRISIIRDGEGVDASSVIDILTLGCAAGCRVTVSIEDRADLELLEEIGNQIESGFGE
jgi:phosphocarrier protein HPr